jgi:hypothetical protein
VGMIGCVVKRGVAESGHWEQATEPTPTPFGPPPVVGSHDLAADWGASRKALAELGGRAKRIPPTSSPHHTPLSFAQAALLIIHPVFLPPSFAFSLGMGAHKQTARRTTPPPPSKHPGMKKQDVRMASIVSAVKEAIEKDKKASPSPSTFLASLMACLLQEELEDTLISSYTPSSRVAPALKNWGMQRGAHRLVFRTTNGDTFYVDTTVRKCDE